MVRISVLIFTSGQVDCKSNMVIGHVFQRPLTFKNKENRSKFLRYTFSFLETLLPNINFYFDRHFYYHIHRIVE